VLSEDGTTVPMGRGNILQAPMAIWAQELGCHRHLNYWYPDKKSQDKAGEPGPIIFDAVHRSLLVRFPDAAEKIAAGVRKGMAAVKLEVELPFKGTEKLARGYKEPTSFVGRNWEELKPRWHAVAWALRKPWQADRKLGPTYNAYINGAAYWKKYGAGDTEHDRHAQQFGPAEVSYNASEKLDITPMLTSSTYGETLVKRLRGLADCGLLVRKWESYDDAFDTPGYEYSILTGSRGIFLEPPRLVVTFKKATRPEKLGGPPPAADIPALVESLKDGKGGKPTAVAPTVEEYETLKQKYAFRPPDGMPDWQKKRVQELYDLGGKANVFPETYEEYLKWLDAILATQPRRFEGFSASDQLALYYRFDDAFPEPVKEHLRIYWESWLMPHMETRDMVHNQYHQIWTKWRPLGTDYFDKTGDWRGNSSFYRESYCRIISTMNFNHTACLGALLGGGFIKSEKAIADGRFGLEHFPLRLWAWYDGTSQESIDHYYLSHTLTAQKMFADYGPTHYDRMMGQSILLKNIDELANCYHPNLRRFISTALRTTPFYAMQVQEGVQHIVHSLSPEGALTDLEKIEERHQQLRQRGAKPVNKLTIIGHDLRPRRVAIQALESPWAPEWTAHIVDRKPIPYSVTTTWRQWGAFVDYPKWKKCYLGHHYGVASFDLSSSPTINLMGLWKRTEGKLTTADDLGMLMIRYGWNRTNFIDTHKGGTLGQMGGGLGVLQHRGKLLVASSPHAELNGHRYNPKKQEIKSLQTSICLFALTEKPTWRIYADGKPVESLPTTLKRKTRITIHDGVTYVGVVPLEATDLGRDAEIVIKGGGKPVVTQTGGRVREGLLIESYNYRSENPFDMGRSNWDTVDLAHGGFAVEVGDVTEHGSFDAFQRHIHGAELQRRWESKTETLHLSYRSGKDRLEMGLKPRGADTKDNRSPRESFPYRRVNGEWPYLPEGVERDTRLSRQGRGVVEKNGAKLTLEPGQMGYVITEPRSGTFLMANPLPDMTWFTFELPDGVKLQADGKIGLARFTVRPRTGELWIDHALNEEQKSGPDMATAIIVSGLKASPTVTLNGQPRQSSAPSLQLAGKTAYAIPLNGAGAKLDPGRLAQAREAAAKAFSAGPKAKAVLNYESGEHYLLTKPRSGAWAFQRLWPSPTVVHATTPEGLAVATDGRLTLRHLALSSRENRVEVDAPAYMQFPGNPAQDFVDKAKALIVFTEMKPTVILNGRPYEGEIAERKLAGRRAHIIPLFGGKLSEALADLESRFTKAQAELKKSD